MKTIGIIVGVLIFCIIVIYCSYQAGKLKMGEILEKTHLRDLDSAEERGYNRAIEESKGTIKNTNEVLYDYKQLYNILITLFVNNCASFRKEYKIAKVLGADKQVVGVRVRVNGEDIMFPGKFYADILNCPEVKYNNNMIHLIPNVINEFTKYINTKYKK